MNIRAPKDFWSGIMFLAFAVVAMLTARGYSLGSAGTDGAGLFPDAARRRAWRCSGSSWWRAHW